MRSILLAVHHDAQTAFQNALETYCPDQQLVVALSPEQARDAFLTWHSELVIVDARLSQGSMLDFVGWLQHESPDTQLIALCELDSFAQVQRIVRPDTADYLIHPFRQEELARLLTSLEERRAAIQESSASLRPVIDRARDEAMEARCQGYIAGLAAGKLSDQEKLELRGMLQSTRGAALVVAMKKPEDLDQAVEVLETYLGGPTGIRFARDTARAQLYALVWLSPQHHSEWLRAQLSAAAAHLRYASGIALDIGASMMCDDFVEDGAKAFDQAAQALAYRFYYENGAVVLYEDNVFAMKQDLPYIAPLADELEKAVTSGNAQAAHEALTQMIQQIDRWPRAQPQRVLRYMQRFLQRLVYLCGGTQAEALAIQATAVVADAKNLRSLSEAAERLIQALLPKRQDTRHAVALCLEAIQKDPAAPLSLEAAAGRYGVMPQALDDGIRASTGLSFLLYQRQMRIATAQRLFEETQLPLASIAAQVGYEDPVHFMRVYQKVTGELPPR